MPIQLGERLSVGGLDIWTSPSKVNDWDVLERVHYNKIYSKYYQDIEWGAVHMELYVPIFDAQWPVDTELELMYED